MSVQTSHYRQTELLTKMKHQLILLFTVIAGIGSTTANAQTLSLDSCRALALKNNKTLAISRTKVEMAQYERRSAQTNYLPKVSLTAGYLRSSEEISLLNDRQKGALTGLGTNLSGQLGQAAQQIIQTHPDLAPLVQQMGQYLPGLGETLNGVGQHIADAFRTDNRNMTVGAIMLTQPLYMSGKIQAYDRITRYAESIANEQLRADAQQIILETDQAYWQVVSLANKRRLALSYRDMLQHLDSDIQKMIAEGVATKANGLTVSVKLNEAEMALTKVENGLTLSRMLLCQVCGLPMDANIRPADENLPEIPTTIQDAEANMQTAYANRPELQQLQTGTDIYREKVNIERSAFLPQIALTGGYITTNPGLTNGFEKKFRGMWNVGVMLSVPVWNWGEGKYKIRAAKAEAAIANYKLDDAREKIELQVNQSVFSVNEANKQYRLSLKNQEKAEENLRMAQAGFSEGVIPTGDLLAAQTAWVQAHSETIDAQINIRLTQAILRKALGTNTYDK